MAGGYIHEQVERRTPVRPKIRRSAAHHRFVPYPLERRRLVAKALNIEPVLSADELDVLVRYSKLLGVANESDPVIRILGHLAEADEKAGSLHGEHRVRRAHRDENAGACVPERRARDDLQERARLLRRLAVEQLRPQVVLLDSDLVQHCRQHTLHSSAASVRTCLAVRTFQSQPNTHSPREGIVIFREAEWSVRTNPHVCRETPYTLVSVAASR